MSKLEKLQYLKQLIAKADFEAVIEELLKLDWGVENDVRKLQARLAIAQKQENFGTASKEDIRTVLNSISNSLVDILAKLQRDFFEEERKIEKSSLHAKGTAVNKELTEVRDRIATLESESSIPTNDLPFAEAIYWLELHKEDLAKNVASKVIGKGNPIHLQYFKLEIDRLLGLIDTSLRAGNRCLLDEMVYEPDYTKEDYSAAFGFMQARISDKTVDEGFKEFYDMLTELNLKLV